MNIIEQIRNEVRKVIVGQNELVDLSMVALVAGGHVLLEGVPGVAKTLFISTLSKVVDLEYKRVSFTPDLMPSDITGTKILNMKTNEFELLKGPIFTSLFLADEINRTPPKTQAGLLEAMAEGHVTIDGEIHELDNPYMVFATQNPLEYEGTYPLPEALLDRFLMKIYVGYPSPEEELEVLRRHNLGFKADELDQVDLVKVCTREDILKLRRQLDMVKVEDGVLKYITDIIVETRRSPLLEVGSSPRGSVALLRCSKAFALLQGRGYVMPEDVQILAIPVLRHRVSTKAEYEIEGLQVENALSQILSKVEVPR